MKTTYTIEQANQYFESTFGEVNGMYGEIEYELGTLQIDLEHLVEIANSEENTETIETIIAEQAYARAVEGTYIFKRLEEHYKQIMMDTKPITIESATKEFLVEYDHIVQSYLDHDNASRYDEDILDYAITVTGKLFNMTGDDIEEQIERNLNSAENKFCANLRNTLFDVLLEAQYEETLRCKEEQDFKKVRPEIQMVKVKKKTKSLQNLAYFYNTVVLVDLWKMIDTFDLKESQYADAQNTILNAYVSGALMEQSKELTYDKKEIVTELQNENNEATSIVILKSK